MRIHNHDIEMKYKTTYETVLKVSNDETGAIVISHAGNSNDDDNPEIVHITYEELQPLIDMLKALL